jgi:O-antigen ligase
MAKGSFPAARRPFVSPTLPTDTQSFGGGPAKPNRLKQIAQPVLAVRDPDALTLFHYAAFLYVVLYLSRFIEFLPGFMRPIMVFSVVLIGGALVSGRILALFQSTTGKVMLGFIVWLGISSIFSSWPKHSIQLTLDMFKVLLTGMVVVAYSSSFRAAAGLLVSAGLGLGLAGAYPFFAGGSILGDRMIVHTTDGGSMGDPNFFALFLVVGVPLVVYAFYRMNKPYKLVPLTLLPLVLYFFVRTGSRSGMIALVAMAIFIFLQVPGKQKVKMLMVAGGGMAILLSLAPSNILLRYTSMVQSEGAASRAQTQEELDELSRAGGSTEGRKHLVRQGILLTLANPIFGVGAGMFATAEQDYAIQVQGMDRGSRHTSHNSFIEASAETGLPGFFLFLTVVYMLFRNLGRIRKWCRTNYHPEGVQISNAALAMQASLVALYVEMCFLSLLYAGFVWLILALAVGVAEGALHELTRPQTLPVGVQQGAPPNVLKRPGVVLAENLARVGNIPVQGSSKQFVGPRSGSRITGDRPIPGVGRRS